MLQKSKRPPQTASWCINNDVVQTSQAYINLHTVQGYQDITTRWSTISLPGVSSLHWQWSYLYQSNINCLTILLASLNTKPNCFKHFFQFFFICHLIVLFLLWWWFCCLIIWWYSYILFSVSLVVVVEVGLELLWWRESCWRRTVMISCWMMKRKIGEQLCSTLP